MMVLLTGILLHTHVNLFSHNQQDEPEIIQLISIDQNQIKESFENQEAIQPSGIVEIAKQPTNETANAIKPAVFQDKEEADSERFWESLQHEGLNKEAELQAEKLKQAETQSQLRLTLIILMLSLLLVSLALIVHSHNARKVLAKQNHYIQEQHQEIEIKNFQITRQNEILLQNQEEILVKSRFLQLQNESLYTAHQIIEVQNEKLKIYAETLERQVEERTSQLTELNQELVKNNQQLEQFGYIVAHNLRAPVARLLGLTALFNLPEVNDEEKAYLLAKTQHEVTMLDEIIGDLNMILKVKKGLENELIKISLEEKLEQVLSAIREDIQESETTLNANFSAAEEIIFIQPYLHSILYNLISNAIKYRSPERKPVIGITSYKTPDNMVCLKVSDNGLGMDLKLHGKDIFGLYKRFHLHKEGKGIGLYLVKTQMEMLGGRIEIESQPGQGTTFYLYFNNAAEFIEPSFA